MGDKNTDCREGRGLTYLKIVFDFVVILVMVWAVLVSLGSNHTAREANILSREALRRAYVPWLKAEDFAVEVRDNGRLALTFVVKNYSDAPAIGCDLKFVFSDKSKPEEVTTGFRNTVFMPNSSQPMFVIHPAPLTSDAKHSIADGKANVPYTLELRFTDIESRMYTLHQSGVGGLTRDELKEYRIEGL